MLTREGICEEDKGSWAINFERHGAPKLATMVIGSRTKATTYLLRGVATVLEQMEKYRFGKKIYAVSVKQGIYLQRLLRTVKLMRI